MRILRVCHEECTKDKKPVHSIFPLNTVHYVVRGHGYFGKRRLGAGEGFFCKYGERVDYRPDPSDPWEYYWITFASDDAKEIFFTINADSDCCFLHSAGEAVAALHNLFCAMQPTENSSLMRSAFVDIFRQLHKDTANTTSSGTRYAILAKGMIEEAVGVGKNPKIEDIAQSLHINRCYLRNLFFKNFGISAEAYKQGVRLESAAKLLRLTAHPINQIAASVGYEDSLAFAKEFKKRYGVSATEYRAVEKTAEHKRDV
jgi:AraC-like DNA-binding protein